VLLEQQHELLLRHDAVVAVRVTRWSCTSPPLPCLSPLVHRLPQHLQRLTVPSLLLFWPDPQQDRDADDAQASPVLQSTLQEEEEQHLVAARTTTSRTTTPPARLHDAEPMLTAGKPLAAPFFFRAGERCADVMDATALGHRIQI
jgi:hypothetical protein